MKRAAPLLAALALSTAVAAAPPGVRVEEHTWIELRDALSAGRRTILVPIGGTEQNGAHLVLGKHNARVGALATRIAAELGDALVAPVIAYVPEGRIEPPTGHMKFPGTITIPEAAFEATLESAARSFRRHGFRHIVFLGDHGGYRRSLEKVEARLNREWAKEPARVHSLPEFYRELPHAGAEDTSLALAITPDQVRTDRLQPGHGAAADPAGATRAVGERMADEIVRRTVEAIKKAASHR